MKKMLCLLSLLVLSLPAFSFQTEKSLKLPVEGIVKLSVEAGAGSLKIEGAEGLASIEVTAEIIVRGVRDGKIDDFLNDHLRLSLEKNGEEAVLKGYFHFTGFRWFSGEASVNLTVRVPKAMDLYVDDGSGWLTVDNLRGEVKIDDGSGELTVADIDGDLMIDDGSGEIEARNITGSVRIYDGSGEIDMRTVTGNVTIDDGSGSMKIVGVGGTVTVDDGSGGIYIDDVAKDVVFESTGSGSVETGNIRGRIIR